MKTIIVLSLMLVLAGCVSTEPAQEAQTPPVSPPQEQPEEPVDEAPEEPAEEPQAEPEEAPPAEEPEPEEPPVPLTSKTASELLDDALDERISDFYKDHSGTFTESTHRWVLTPPADGSLVGTPASEVKFDDQVISSIQATGYIIFEKDGDEDVYGVAVFNAQQTILDGMFAPFDVELFYGRDLGWCRVTQKDVYQWSSGGFVSVYQFGCESASDED